MRNRAEEEGLISIKIIPGQTCEMNHYEQATSKGSHIQDDPSNGHRRGLLQSRRPWKTNVIVHKPSGNQTRKRRVQCEDASMARKRCCQTGWLHCVRSILLHD